MVELKVHIQKKHVWLLALLIGAVGFVIAQGGMGSGQGTPNPGHDVTQIGGLDAKIDKKIADKLASGAIKLDCTIAFKGSTKANPPKGGGSFIECPAGYVLTGGGGSLNWPYNQAGLANTKVSGPNNVPNKMDCNDFGGVGCWHLTAVCCRIQAQ